MNAIIESADLIGARLVDSYGNEGFVYDVREAPGNVFVIGGGGLAPARFDYLICWQKGENSHLAELRDQIAAPLLERAAHLDPVTDPTQREKAIEHARNCAAEAARKRKLDQEQERVRLAEFREECKRRVPSWAKAAIVAELEEDDSDGMTDYFNTKTRKRVILGFSKHHRDLFPEMRKFAGNYPETAHLAEAGPEAEHREKYSMGAGYYLKASHRYSTGWKISKEKFYGDREAWDCVPFADDWATDTPSPEPVAVGVDGIRIEEHTHTKKGYQMFICILPDRVDRDEFNRLREAARALGGWYSRPWGKTPGGFAFKEKDAAESFANPGPSTSGPDDGPKPGNAALADRFREMADKMQGDIDHKFADRRTNTPKQQREAGNARIDGMHLERTQKALRALAELHQAENVPPVLAHLNSKKAIHDLTKSKVDYSGGYYDPGRDSGEPYHDSADARAVWALLEDDGGRRAAIELENKVNALKLANIPGYFPTPAPVVAEMIEHARLEPGSTVLEPEAGSGAIAEGVKAAEPSAELILFEIRDSLREILELKGFDPDTIGADFLLSDAGELGPVDRVLMNPPFEKGQDMDHVRHAYEALKPGGRLVAIMGPGFTFRSDNKSRSFREWFYDNGGEIVAELPSGTFKESGTGVSTLMIVMDREG